jgi:hypothetical protein
MNLIKLSTKFYPYTIAELQADFPNVSFPAGLVGVDLGEFDAAEVITDEPPPHDPAVEVLEPLPPKKMKGIWRVRWEKRKLTKAEIRSRTPADWVGFADALMGDDDFGEFYVIAHRKHPALANSVIAAFNGDPIRPGILSGRWERFCDVAEIPAARRHEWANMAEDYYFLPDYCIAMLRGKQNG